MTNLQTVLSYVSFLYSKKKIKNRIASVRRSINLISILCHYMLILVCISYLNRNSQSITILEKGEAYGDKSYFYTNIDNYNLSNDFVNIRKILTFYHSNSTRAGISTITDQQRNYLGYINQSSTKKPIGKINSDNILCWIIIFSIFFIKLRSKRSSKWFYIYLFFYTAFLYVFNFKQMHRENSTQKLKLCTKKQFFTIETLNLSSYITNLTIKNNFEYLVKCKIQYKHYHNFFQLALLLSGDVELNPGDSQVIQIRDSDIWNPMKKKGLHFLHLNVNSLIPKIDEIRNIAFKTKAAVIGITESKLDNSINDIEVKIDGYSIIRNDRNRNGGGVACYIRNDLCFNSKTIFDKQIETVFFEILIPKMKSILIGIFYRPPTQNEFLEHIIKDLHTIDFTKQEVFILGDFNVNLFYNNKYILDEKNDIGNLIPLGPLINKYKELCQTFSLKQLIMEPTRISSHTSTLLDHVLTNAENKISNSGVIDIGISDHQLIYCTRKIERNKLNTHNQTKVRSFKNYSMNILKNSLTRAGFPNYNLFTNVDIAYLDFIEKISQVVDSIAPLKDKRIKINSQDWFDGDIAEQIRIRNKLLKKFKVSKLHIDEILFKEQRKNVINLVKSKKQTFYKSKLQQNIGKPKELWKTLKSLGLPNKGSCPTKTCLQKEGIKHFDDKSNATIFKDFFCNLAKNLVSKLPSPSKKFSTSSLHSYYKTSNELNASKLIFNQISSEVILDILENIDPGKAAGIDNISGKILRDGASILAAPISQICNISIKYSVFPKECKIAKLKLLFKKGPKTNPKNYRPISLLPLISKIIEKVIHDQTQKFLNENNLFYHYQSGFRKNYSTNSCLSYLQNKILQGFDSNLSTGMILIDLQKAFDTIDHKILLDKMYYFGFSEKVVLWFKSYLSEREFKVNLNGTFSEPGLVTCGVPQGSILGPLLFLLYMNDIPQSVKCELLLYADDTCLISQHKKIEVIEENLNNDFSNICEWFIDNKLSIHLGEDKTKSILFSSKRKVKTNAPLNITYGNVNIKQHSKVTYLGCILDNTLSGESMALHVINKVNIRLKFLYRQNKFLTRYLRRLLCNALIQPLFDYACSAWYPNINQNLKTRLQSAQNKCIRFCLQLGPRESIKSNHFELINWLKVEDRVSQSICASVFNFFENKCPDYMSEIYFPADQNGINTRHSYNRLILPARKTNAGLKALSYIGPATWNKVPHSIKCSKTLNGFKHNIKEFYLLETRKKESLF